MKHMKRNDVAKLLNLLVGDRLKIIRVCRPTVNSKASKIGTLCDQLLDSVIVSGITGVSTYIYAGGDASLKSAILSFLLTFLVKLKEYRKIP
jgi:hypothetical protein